uniref:AA_permease domain-containing protein n=1 Tax=Rhabditophanes sp. KR3021 TaxID=114890 RepID=A0AC35TMV5_9BILA
MVKLKRFQVTKSSQNLEEHARMSEEPFALPVEQGNGVMTTHHASTNTLKSEENGVNSRKTSSAGRFIILAPTQSKESSLNDESHNQPQDHILPLNQRTVKFNVADLKENSLDYEGTIGSDHNNTVNLKSLRNFKTLERPPIMDYYRNTVDPNKPMSVRPSMAQLINGQDEMEGGPNDPLLCEARRKSNESNSGASKPRKKFGWIEGVFFRCILNIFGVMLYLRVSWVAGQAGIIFGTGVVLLASLVTTITALSTCAICTNGDVKGGGAYFLISRSLGPEFGGSIGIIFSFANAVSAAMYVVGFSETVRDILVSHELKIIDGGLNDVRIIGLITCALLMCIVFIGTGFESKMQMGLLVILTLSIINYFIGIFLRVPGEKALKGVTGLSMATMWENMLPNFKDQNFFSVFSIYFPAATKNRRMLKGHGIMAGANVSGDLTNPSQAIPLGTLSAIFGTTIVYILTIWSTGSTCLREADGINVPLYQQNASSGITGYIQPECAANGTCPYGLMNYFQIMELTSVWGPLITAGIFAATLSSALASLVSAPKIFQAVSKDRLFPYINHFGKGSGKGDEPRKAYLLGFVIAMVMILIGELNAIAPIISNFFLASYALINYACFDNSMAQSPGFRPSFKYYNMWISLMGALLCVVVMFIVSWVTALVTFVCFAGLYLFLIYRKPDVNWGSSGAAHSYKTALKGMIKLSETVDHVKNYRPQILVLSGNPHSRPSLIDFASNISKGSSLLVLGNVMAPTSLNSKTQNLTDYNLRLTDWCKQRHIKCFVSSFPSKSLRQGAHNLTQICGLGKLRPDIVLMGFKANWSSTPDNLQEINEYFGIVLDSFESNMGVCILRNAASGFDFSDMMEKLNMGDHDRLKISEKVVTVSEGMSKEESFDVVETTAANSIETEDESKLTERTPSYLDINDIDDEDVDEDEDNTSQSSTPSHKDPESNHSSKVHFDNEETFEEHHSTLNHLSINEKYGGIIRRKSTRRPTAAQKELLTSINRFKNKIKQPIIDVWWLFDDGGLTLLIPYLLSIPKSYLENAKLRVFTVSASSGGIEQMQRGMAGLLKKFRIDVSNLHVINDITRKPQHHTMERFNKLIEPFRCSLSENSPEGMISDAELAAQKDKTNRQLRTAELLHEHSKDADLICITLPVPRKNMVSSALYLAWLDTMTANLPPTLCIRGNQSSVLTYYS